MTSIEKIRYADWAECYRVYNDIVDLVVTAEVGPRIIRFGFIDEKNLFCEVQSTLGKSGGEQWLLYGGHRFWHAPEAKPRTYYPDNAPIQIEEHDSFIRVIQPTEPTTGIQKELDIRLNKDTPHVRIIHRLRNHNLWAIEMAPWALSVMRAGGVGIIPLPPRGTHEESLLPSNTLTLWAYTDMSDPRWRWGKRYILLHQDPEAASPQKIGADAPDGWGAYICDNYCFLKLFEHQPEGIYPDMGCSMEMFTNHFMLELETLGPLIRVQPGMTAEHTEDWFLFRDIEIPDHEDHIEKHILPLAQEAKKLVMHA